MDLRKSDDVEPFEAVCGPVFRPQAIAPTGSTLSQNWSIRTRDSVQSGGDRPQVHVQERAAQGSKEPHEGNAVRHPIATPVHELTIVPALEASRPHSLILIVAGHGRQRSDDEEGGCPCRARRAGHARLDLARISHTVTAEGFGGSVGAEFLPREQVEREQAALRPCFRGARVAGTAA